MLYTNTVLVYFLYTHSPEPDNTASPSTRVHWNELPKGKASAHVSCRMTYYAAYGAPTVTHVRTMVRATPPSTHVESSGR